MTDYILDASRIPMALNIATTTRNGVDGVSPVSLSEFSDFELSSQLSAYSLPRNKKSLSPLMIPDQFVSFAPVFEAEIYASLNGKRVSVGVVRTQTGEMVTESLGRNPLYKMPFEALEFRLSTPIAVQSGAQGYLPRAQVNIGVVHSTDDSLHIGRSDRLVWAGIKDQHKLNSTYTDDYFMDASHVARMAPVKEKPWVVEAYRTLRAAFCPYDKLFTPSKITAIAHSDAARQA